MRQTDIEKLFQMAGTEDKVSHTNIGYSTEREESNSNSKSDSLESEWKVSFKYPLLELMLLSDMLTYSLEKQWMLLQTRTLYASPHRSQVF